MELSEKIAIVMQSITSISTQGDLDTGLRTAALAQIAAFCASETTRLNAALQASITANIPTAE